MSPWSPTFKPCAWNSQAVRDRSALARQWRLSCESRTHGRVVEKCESGLEVREMNDERPTLERIMQVASGGWALAILAAAVHHSVFTHVESGADTVEALARNAGVSARGAGTLLDGLVGLGFLTVSGGRYRNAP